MHTHPPPPADRTQNPQSICHGDRNSANSCFPLNQGTVLLRNCDSVNR